MNMGQYNSNWLGGNTYNPEGTTAGPYIANPYL